MRPGEAVMKLRCLIVALCALLVLVPAALGAGGSAGSGYGGKGGVQNEVNQGGVHAVASKGSLPFTGLDLALLVVGGISLVVVGAGLRRASKRSA
jgi:hypothetical protein